MPRIFYKNTQLNLSLNGKSILMNVKACCWTKGPSVNRAYISIDQWNSSTRRMQTLGGNQVNTENLS